MELGLGLGRTIPLEPNIGTVSLLNISSSRKLSLRMEEIS